MNLKSIRICFIGHMLGRNANYITTQGQIVADLFASEGYKVTCVSSKINRAARLAETTQTLIKGFRDFDIVLVDTYSGLSFITYEITSFLCRLFKIPLIMVLRGGSLPEFMQKHPRWTKRVLNRANVLVAPSAFMAEKIGKWGYDIPIITNIVDLSRYPYRERKNISPNLIWMRSFHPVNNPEMAVDVFAKLHESYPQSTLTFAGADKGLQSKIKQMVEEKGLSNSVRFAGFLNLEKKIKEFADADIYLNTNRVDNMPVSVIEARALGLPVIATNVGGLPYLIKHGENGFLVPNEDADAMLQSVLALLDNPELTQKISQNGRSLAEESAWTLVRPKWEALISEVLENMPKKKSKFWSLRNKLTAGKLEG